MEIVLVKLDKDKIIPPIEMNHNAGWSHDEYRDKFALEEIHKFFPFCLKMKSEFSYSTKEINFLDIGCGAGAMAFPFHKYCPELKDGRYVGIDIKEPMIKWLADSYDLVENVSFVLQEASSNVDYTGSAESNFTDGKTFSSSNGDEANYNLSGKFNIQWSHSVFTHMTPESCLRGLSSASSVMEPGGIMINTWLIVDNLSFYSLRMGIADRKLPFEFDNFFSYSVDNPLVCTAYKIEFILHAYESAGLEIIEIMPGYWRGHSDNNVTYQDIVISRLKRR